MESSPRLYLRLYFDLAVTNFETLEDFITVLNCYNVYLKAAGAALPDPIRIWHCLNCLHDASSEWPTKLLQLGGKFAKLGYWEKFTDWDKFSGQLIRRTGDRRITPYQQSEMDTENRCNPHPGSDSNDSISYSYAERSSDIHGDGHHASSGNPQEKEITGIAARATKPNGFDKQAAKNEHAPKADDSSRAVAVPDHDTNQPFGNNSLNDYADYQDRGDDVQDFADEDENEVTINGECRLVIPGHNSARRGQRGFLIDTNIKRIQQCFNGHFPSRPKCLDCKLKHPVKAYAFCRYCYFCHMGGEEECYHLHPELRGTRPKKGKYRHIDNSGPNIDRYIRNGVDASTIELHHLAEFGYYADMAVTRVVVRNERWRIKRLPIEEQAQALQGLLRMVEQDRALRLEAQHAVLNEEEEQAVLEAAAIEAAEREAREQAEAAERERQRLQMEQDDRERRERERRAKEQGQQRRPKRSKKSGTPLMPGHPYKGQTRSVPQDPITQLSDLVENCRLSSNGPDSVEQLEERLGQLSIPDPVLAPPRSPAPSSLGTGLAVPQTLQNDAARQSENRPAKTAQALVIPAFMRNRRRWASMSSLSTSSSEESIQQFDRKQRELTERKKKNKAKRKNKGKTKAQAVPGGSGGAAL